MAQAVVLAAGLSSRVQTNKLTLMLGQKSVIETLVITLKQYCAKVIVVTGHYRKDVEDLLYGIDGVICVHNEGYATGMFSSVVKGMEYVTEDVLLTPGDSPFILESTINALLAAEGELRVPVFEGRWGHPLFIGQALIPALLKEPMTSTLKQFRNRYPVTEVVVMDPGSLKDIDTIEDYHRMKKEWKGAEDENPKLYQTVESRGSL